MMNTNTRCGKNLKTGKQSVFTTGSSLGVQSYLPFMLVALCAVLEARSCLSSHVWIVFHVWMGLSTLSARLTICLCQGFFMHLYLYTETGTPQDRESLGGKSHDKGQELLYTFYTKKYDFCGWKVQKMQTRQLVDIYQDVHIKGVPIIKYALQIDSLRILTLCLCTLCQASTH